MLLLKQLLEEKKKCCPVCCWFCCWAQAACGRWQQGGLSHYNRYYTLGEYLKEVEQAMAENLPFFPAAFRTGGAAEDGRRSQGV